MERVLLRNKVTNLAADRQGRLPVRPTHDAAQGRVVAEGQVAPCPEHRVDADAPNLDTGV